VIEVVVIQRRNGIWHVGIGSVSTSAIERGLETFRSSVRATKAAQALAKRTGLLIYRPPSLASRHSDAK